MTKKINTSGTEKTAEVAAPTWKSLQTDLARFCMDFLGAKVQDGITYVLLREEDKNKERFDRLSTIRRQLSEMGKAENEVFRVYKVSNGYIFDIDLKTARDITAQLAMAELGSKTDLIGNLPEKRRAEDIERLAKSCVSWYKKGVTVVEVALFSRNSVPRINITGKDAKTKQPKLVTYEAYAVRHWDIDTVNQLLAKNGIRIMSVDTHEILPSETGLRVTLHIGVI